MSNVRTGFSQAQLVALVSQVNRICPLCDVPLFYRKGSRSYKGYEVAHIYPLNPLVHEATLLNGQEVLGKDLNDEENLIPLCVPCHTKFDKPRTLPEYLQLVAIKKALLKEEAHQLLVSRHDIQADIAHVVTSLYSDAAITAIPLEFIPVEMDQKLNGEIQNITKRKIKGNVVNYFTFVKNRFAEMDALNPSSADIVATQVKIFYLQQKKLGLTQQEIFQNIVDWISSKAAPKTLEAAEIVVSFFIQNCEIFDDNAKQIHNI